MNIKINIINRIYDVKINDIKRNIKNILLKMEEIDIEQLNFDEYNRQVYLVRNPIKEKKMKLLNLSKAQKRYKFKIDQFFVDYNEASKNEFEGSNFGILKKRKY